MYAVTVKMFKNGRRNKNYFKLFNLVNVFLDILEPFAKA